MTAGPVTDKRIGDYSPIQPAVTEQSTGPVTDRRTAAYAAGGLAVTCRRCGKTIPTNENMVVHPQRVAWNPPEEFCLPCVNALVKEPPYYPDYFPWHTWGARQAGRTAEEYQHWCEHCGRPFIGAIVRRYCTERCAQLAHKMRRKRLPAAEVRWCVVCCAVCGRTFTPPRSDARYCSPRCRQKAYRARKPST